MTVDVPYGMWATAALLCLLVFAIWWTVNQSGKIGENEWKVVERLKAGTDWHLLSVIVAGPNGLADPNLLQGVYSLEEKGLLLEQKNPSGHVEIRLTEACVVQAYRQSQVREPGRRDPRG